MKTYALAALAAAAALTGVVSAGAVTIAKEEASGTTDASVSVDVTMRRVKYSRVRVAPSAAATVQSYLRLGYGGEETPTGQVSGPVAVTGSVSVSCKWTPAGNFWPETSSARWTYRQAPDSRVLRTYRLPPAPRGAMCTFAISADAAGPSRTDSALPNPEYPSGSETGTRTTETVVHVLVTSLR